jgi:hypothetical protein
MNSPNNLLFDWEMAASRVRKAFESVPESDLDNRDYRLASGRRQHAPRGDSPNLLSAICSLLFANRRQQRFPYLAHHGVRRVENVSNIVLDTLS